MNQHTLDKMLAPRCGLPDVISPKDRTNNRGGNNNLRNKPLEYNAPGKPRFQIVPNQRVQLIK